MRTDYRRSVLPLDTVSQNIRTPTNNAGLLSKLSQFLFFQNAFLNFPFWVILLLGNFTTANNRRWSESGYEITSAQLTFRSLDRTTDVVNQGCSLSCDAGRNTHQSE